MADPLGIGAPPSGGGSASRITPRLGLPENAIVTNSDGSEWTFDGPAKFGVEGGGYTEKDLIAIFASMPSEKLATLQNQLRGIGLIGKGATIAMGALDSTTRSALAELLGISNLRSKPWEQSLAELQKVGGVAAAAAAEMPQFNTRLNTYESSDPASVRLTAEEAFQKALGRKPKKAEQDRFVSAFLGRQRAAQAEVFAAQDQLDAQGRRQATAAATGQTLPASGANSESDELWSRIQTMIADAPGKITQGKRTRDYATQVKLWERSKRGGPQAAKPGTSKHGDGRANDLQYGDEATRAWVLKNAHRYGLHFPIYNPKLGRSHDESWHVELAPGVREGIPVPRGSQFVAGQPPISTNVVVQGQDMGAQAIEFARAQNPTETAAYDIGQTFQNFTAILSKGVI